MPLYNECVCMRQAMCVVKPFSSPPHHIPQFICIVNLVHVWITVPIFCIDGLMTRLSFDMAREVVPQKNTRCQAIIKLLFFTCLPPPSLAENAITCRGGSPATVLRRYPDKIKMRPSVSMNRFDLTVHI